MNNLHESETTNLPLGKFPLGHVVATPSALDHIDHQEMQTALRRHHAGDWGDLDEHDRRENERGLLDGSRLFSQYKTQEGVKFWIITESDRSVTTILLPSEY